MKQILTTLLLLFSLTLFAQTTVVTGPKKKPQTTTVTAKPKQQASQPKQQKQQAAKPKQQQATPKQKSAAPALKPQQKQNPKTNSKPQSKQPTISTPTGYENGHGYVDLGLSVKWATMNVGASSPTDYGGYYAWGETRTKSTYDWSTYFDTNDGGKSFIKYVPHEKTTLDLSDDAAHVNWGGSWRMPTSTEQDELLNSCTWTWTTMNGIKGYMVSSKRNGNSIFLPAAGISFRSVGSFGGYWSSLGEGFSAGDAHLLIIDSLKPKWFAGGRYNGLSVRAVCQ